MRRSKFFPVFLLGALVLTTILGFGVYRTVSAAAEAQTTAPPAQATAAPETDTAPANGTDASPSGKPFRFEKEARAFGSGQSDEYLANALGITVDELTAAYEQAYTAALDQAVADGLITQAQADELKANGNAFPFGGRWRVWLNGEGIDLNAHLADALGIGVEALEQAFTEAQNARLDQAVADGQLTQEQADLMKAQRALVANDNYQTSMQSAFESAVQQAVNGGVITQAQADQILQNAEGQTWGLPGRGGHGGHGGRGGRGGHHGFGLGLPGEPGGDVPALPAAP